jgi:hypothetical protein
MKVRNALILTCKLALMINLINHICFLFGIFTSDNSYENLLYIFNNLLIISLVFWTITFSELTFDNHSFDILSWIRNFSNRLPIWLVLLSSLIISYGFFLTSVVTVGRLVGFKNLEYYNTLNITGTPLIAYTILLMILYKY